MYHKGIPFAEHNFGPFQDILFESQSKTGISKYLNFMREVRPEIHFRSAKTLRCLNPIARKTILKVKLHLQCDLHMHRATGAPYWPILACGGHVRVKTRYFEKFKINIFLLAVFKRHFPHESA